MLSSVEQTSVVYIYLKKYYVANLGQLSHATFFAIFLILKSWDIEWNHRTKTFVRICKQFFVFKYLFLPATMPL